MPKSAKKTEPLVYPPLTLEFEARLRKAGHGHLVGALRGVKESTIEGLMKAMESGPVVQTRAGGRSPID